MIANYNQSYGFTAAATDTMLNGALPVPQQRVLPEDVLR